MDSHLKSTASQGVIGNHTSAVMSENSPTSLHPDWTLSLLMLSLTIHGCTVLFLLSRTALNRWAKAQSRNTKNSLAALHLKSDWLLPKVLTEQLATWSLIILSVLDLSSGDFIDYPFVPKFSQDLTLSRVVFCVTMGKHVYKGALSLLYLQHQARYKVDLLHHIVTLCCYGVFHYYSENILLGLAGILMECDTIWSDTVGILRKLSCGTNSTVYRRLVILSLAVTVFSRGILPVTTIAIALSKQNLMSLHFVVILFWFIALIFFGALNIWMIAVAVLRLRGICFGHPLPGRLGDDVEDIPPIGESPSSSTSQENRAASIDRTIPLQYRNDLSYLSPFSNVNITYDTTDIKYNLYKNKIGTKDTVNNISVLLKQSQPRTNGGLRTSRPRTARRCQDVRHVNESSSQQINEANVDSSSNTQPRTSGGNYVNGGATNNSTHVVNLETRLDETSSGVRHVVFPSSNTAQRLPEWNRREQNSNTGDSSSN